MSDDESREHVSDPAEEAVEVTNLPHVYIHVPPQKTGGKYERFIVPASKIKKFDYHTYVENSGTYKDKIVRYKNAEGKKVKCFVLYAAENFIEVEAKVSSGKRFHVPTVRQSDVSDTSNVTNSEKNAEIHPEDQHEGNIKRAKLARKEAKNLKLQSSQETNDQILNKYLQSVDSNNDKESYESEDIENLYSPSSVKRSTPRNTDSRPFRPSHLNYEHHNTHEVVDRHDHSECLNTISGFKQQVHFFKDKYQAAKNEAEQWKLKFENIVKQNPQISFQSDNSLLEYYDKLYKYDGPLALSEELDSIKLLHNVECKAISYKEAFKSSKPIHVIKSLMYGIYGYEDLVNRCQKREPESDSLQPLCAKRSEAIERELYRFLRLNNYTIHLIKLELQEIDKYYHNAISSARLKKKRKDKAEEALKMLEEQTRQAERLLQS